MQRPRSQEHSRAEVVEKEVAYVFPVRNDSAEDADVGRGCRIGDIGGAG